MLNRRSFVKMGSLAAGASFATACSSEAPASAQPAATPAPGAVATLPPSIAALTSMRDQASPITADERRGRIEKARRLMAEHKIDALMLTGGTSLVYFSGMQWGLSERLFAMVLPVKGDAFVRLSRLRGGSRARADRQGAARRHGRRAHLGRAREPVRAGRPGAEGSRHRLRPARHRRDRPVRVQRRRRAGRAGGEDHQRHAGHRRLPRGEGRARAGADAVGVAGDAQGVRGGVEGAQGRHDAGRLRRARRRSPIASSASQAAPACRSASTRRCPTARSPRRSMREGSILLIDGGCSVEGYASDISRTFVLGKPTDKMKAGVRDRVPRRRPRR